MKNYLLTLSLLFTCFIAEAQLSKEIHTGISILSRENERYYGVSFAYYKPLLAKSHFGIKAAINMDGLKIGRGLNTTFVNVDLLVRWRILKDARIVKWFFEAGVSQMVSKKPYGGWGFCGTGLSATDEKRLSHFVTSYSEFDYLFGLTTGVSMEFRLKSNFGLNIGASPSFYYSIFRRDYRDYTFYLNPTLKAVYTF